MTEKELLIFICVMLFIFIMLVAYIGGMLSAFIQMWKERQ